MKKLVLKTLFQKLKNLLFVSPRIFKQYYIWFLLIFFFCIIILWAWIFYKHVYLVTTIEPEVFIKEPKIFEAELEKVLGDIERREKLFQSLPSMVYPDPFR